MNRSRNFLAGTRSRVTARQVWTTPPLLDIRVLEYLGLAEGLESLSSQFSERGPTNKFHLKVGQMIYNGKYLDGGECGQFHQPKVGQILSARTPMGHFKTI